MVQTATFRSYHRSVPRPGHGTVEPNNTQDYNAREEPPTSRPPLEMRVRREAARVGAGQRAGALFQGPVSPLRPVERPAEAVAPSRPTLLERYRIDPFSLEYYPLCVADPRLCKVAFGPFGNIPLTAERTGIYRPDGAREAPWSGLAYDVSADGRTGLAAGTRILTARGEIAVEDLVPGDLALGLRGSTLLPIAWIGRSLATAPLVQIAADAFGPGRPRHALSVGPDHAIFVDAIPVAAQDLVDGHSVKAVSGAAELFHIDIGAGEILLAEAMPLASVCR